MLYNTEENSYYLSTLAHHRPLAYSGQILDIIFGGKVIPRTVRDTNLETRTARGRLSPRGKPYYRAIESGLHIGYRKGKQGGKGVVRTLTGDDKYRVETFGLADDISDADGVRVLDWKQAQAWARERCAEYARAAAGFEPEGPYTVADAVRDYLVDYEGRGGRSLPDMRSRTQGHILPRLGQVEVKSLTANTIREWHRSLAKEPPRVRSGKSDPGVKYRDNSDDPNATRKRQYSSNKVLTILKSALNHAWHEGKVQSDDAWRRVKPFKGVDSPRVHYLKQAECVRLVNSCPPDFRRVVQAALFTGCRYGEIANFLGTDFNPDSGTVHVRESKVGKARHVVLTDGGQSFFSQIVAGRSGNDRIFLRADGKPWGKAHQHRPLAKACDRASIQPRASFHILRHTYASNLVMNGVSLHVVSKNLGHADLRMTAHHYAHLAPSYVADAIRAGAPELGVAVAHNVIPLQPRTG